MAVEGDVKDGLLEHRRRKMVGLGLQADAQELRMYKCQRFRVRSHLLHSAPQGPNASQKCLRASLHSGLCIHPTDGGHRPRGLLDLVLVCAFQKIAGETESLICRSARVQKSRQEEGHSKGVLGRIQNLQCSTNLAYFCLHNFHLRCSLQIRFQQMRTWFRCDEADDWNPS